MFLKVSRADFPSIFPVRPGNLWVELGSSLALSEEAVEFTAGGVEGALVVFRAIMNERSAVLMDHAT
jgi:hypothetical protein